MGKNKVRVAVVGLGFGAQFVAIHMSHPDVESVAICDAVTAAHWTAAGICAHESAMAEGREVTVPEFAW